MPFELILLLGTVLVAIVIAFAVSALVGWAFAQRLQGPEVPRAVNPIIPSRPPGG